MQHQLVQHQLVQHQLVQHQLVQHQLVQHQLVQRLEARVTGRERLHFLWICSSIPQKMKAFSSLKLVLLGRG
ncbi:hypothetical protein [Abditibacterium utsteinense]|uniref:hypothetical protein n=1 Tax=Abditibacterium utsteinense TaxID=1960156 RepID=UPI000D08952F|nr:hypothetical protein [Abditibacterium utsteinense]